MCSFKWLQKIVTNISNFINPKTELSLPQKILLHQSFQFEIAPANTVLEYGAQETSPTGPRRSKMKSGEVEQISQTLKIKLISILYLINNEIP